MRPTALLLVTGLAAGLSGVAVGGGAHALWATQATARFTVSVSDPPPGEPEVPAAPTDFTCSWGLGSHRDEVSFTWKGNGGTGFEVLRLDPETSLYLGGSNKTSTPRLDEAAFGPATASRSYVVEVRAFSTGGSSTGNPRLTVDFVDRGPCPAAEASP